METVIVNDRGQITIPVQLRRQLGLKSGDSIRLSFDEEKKALSLKPLASIREAYGILPKPDKKRGIQQMTEAVELAVAEACVENC